MADKNTLQELFYLFARAEQAYACYLKNKVYLYASIIRKANNSIYRLLEANLSSFDEEQSMNALQLLFHYDVWMAQYDELQQQLNPSITSVFVFEIIQDGPPFPKESKEAFVEAYKKLKV
jgi:hypothetical protein